MFQAFLIKYAEIGIKGKNRYIFENQLKSQIEISLEQIEGEFFVAKEQGRLYIEARGEFDYEETIEVLQRVFGIKAICPVVLIEEKDWDNITKTVKDYIEKEYSKKDFTFKVEAKRSDKKYPMTSPEICVQMGAFLLKQFPKIKVDVHHPEVRVYVEIRERAYIYSKVIKGLGGMPVGCNGKAMLLLSGGIDSPVAGYMIAKRGVRIEAVYFHAPPYTSERAKQKVIELAKQMAKYTGPIKLYVINFTDIQLAIYDKCPHEELTIIMRRFMMKIAQHFAKLADCLGLITGESIGQVASQTMQSLFATNEVCSMPVYRPLIGFDKQDIIDISEKIHTYEISIQPFEDCCTIFVAKHPVTKPALKRIQYSEKNLEKVIDTLMKEAIETVQIIEIK